MVAVNHSAQQAAAKPYHNTQTLISSNAPLLIFITKTIQNISIGEK
jgi:hypothetical protein